MIQRKEARMSKEARIGEGTQTAKAALDLYCRHCGQAATADYAAGMIGAAVAALRQSRGDRWTYDFMQNMTDQVAESGDLLKPRGR